MFGVWVSRGGVWLLFVLFLLVIFVVFGVLGGVRLSWRVWELSWVKFNCGGCLFYLVVFCV